MQKIKMICPIDSEQRTPLRTDGRGESDNPPKFSIENSRGAKNKRIDRDIST